MEEVIDLEDDDVLGLVSDDDEEVSPPNYHHETTDEPQEQDDDGDAAMLAAAAVAVALGQQEEQAAAKEAERKKRKEKQQKKRKEKGKDKPEHAFLSGAGLEEVDVEAGQSGLMETTYIGETKTKKKKKRKSKKKKRVNPFSSTVVHSWSWSTFYKNPEFRKRMGTVIIAALCCLLGLIFFVSLLFACCQAHTAASRCTKHSRTGLASTLATFQLMKKPNERNVDEHFFAEQLKHSFFF